jgi:hypothetical protein
MRVRTIATVVILSAGCGTSGTARSSGRPAPVVASATPEMAVAPATPAAPAPAVTSLPAPVSAAAVTSSVAPIDLEALADQLRGTPREQVAASDARFRPLCDAAGYPLVGNLITKESASLRRQRYDVSDHCAAIRSAR